MSGIFLVGAGINVGAAQDEIQHDGLLEITIDSTTADEDFILVLKGKNGLTRVQITGEPGFRSIHKVIEEAAKPKPKPVDVDEYRIQPFDRTVTTHSGKTFNDLIEQLTALDVTGFKTWFDEKERVYCIKLGEFTTKRSPFWLSHKLMRINHNFGVMSFKDVVRNG